MDTALSVVNRSNQRGGRMLSVIDLLDAGSLSMAQACWLLDRITKGASFLIGAQPGGAGKTTIMGALLAMLPAGETVRLARQGTGWESSGPGDCIVAYEIGRGHYEAYVWGDTLVRMTALGQAGCRIVTNLHADTLDQAREQIVQQCGAGEAGLAAFDLFIPIETSLNGERGMTRVVGTILQHEDGRWQPFDPLQHVPSGQEQAARAFLERCSRENMRTVEAVRASWLAESGA
jgi:hypothetical protein